ncbi:MAG: molybdopterin-dependent oxidoreductase, partial [Firmicutes bacterium]|nr:molybdopterin-dependent oxidoreductase [Bacillota bacterium]
AVIERVSDYMQIDPDELDCEDAYVFEKANPENRVHVGWCMIHTDCVPIHLHHARHTVREQAGLPFGAWFAEVEVDVELGTVEVTDLAVVNDAGTVLHASGCESHQIAGQCFGIGETLTEEMHYDWETGTPLNNNYIEYKMITMPDRANVKPELLEVWQGLGRYGAAGVAEGAFCGTAPAIANAVYNAVGVEIDAQPITPQKVMKGLEELKAREAAAAFEQTAGDSPDGSDVEGKEGR